MMLDVLPLEDAVELVKSLCSPIARRERVPLSAVPGRVLAEDVRSPETVPAFCRSTMDGWAVAAADVFGAMESSPVPLIAKGEVKMGEETRLRLSPGECVKIPTGGMLPENADAVVPVEYTETDPAAILVYKGVSPFQYVVRPGEDVSAGDVLRKAFSRLTPADAGAFAAAGIAQAEVIARPRVGVLSTGNELTSDPGPLPPGKVRDVNSSLLSAWLQKNGCVPSCCGIIPDEETAFIESLVKAAEENDLVLLSGGSSAGEADLTAKVLKKIGSLLAHGIAMKPGKPTVIGTVGKTPVFGLPGHPAACFFVAEALVRPALEVLSGAGLPQRKCAAVLSENVGSNHGREEFLCVRLENGTAYPVYGKSGVLTQLSASDGYIRIPRDAEGLRKGETVAVVYY